VGGNYRQAFFPGVERGANPEGGRSGEKKYEKEKKSLRMERGEIGKTYAGRAARLLSAKFSRPPSHTAKHQLRGGGGYAEGKKPSRGRLDRALGCEERSSKALAAAKIKEQVFL